MRHKELPPAHILRQLLEYDPITGTLVWRERDPSWFGGNRRACSLWNVRYANSQAGRAGSYVIVKVLGSGFGAHRLIWKIVTGDDPDEIDHINRDKHDNRWANLRSVNHAANMRNKGLTRINTSGHKHIHWSDKTRRWVVQLIVPGKGQRQVAWEKTLPDAVNARNRLMVRYGYDPLTDAA
jgi:hypothetical protein